LVHLEDWAGGKPVDVIVNFQFLPPEQIGEDSPKTKAYLLNLQLCDTIISMTISPVYVGASRRLGLQIKYEKPFGKQYTPILIHTNEHTHTPD